MKNTTYNVYCINITYIVLKSDTFFPQIMPQHINAPITNSPYHGQITETDEGLMELRPDMQQPMYGGAFSKVRSGTSPSEDVVK